MNVTDTPQTDTTQTEGAGPVVVAVTNHAALPEAALYVSALGCAKPVTVGASLAEDAAWKANGVRVAGRTTSSRQAVAALTRYLAEGKFLHANTDALTAQVLELRTSPGVDGPRIRSTGRMDAVKAAVWAVQDASVRGRRKQVIPSRFATRRAG